MSPLKLFLAIFIAGPVLLLGLWMFLLGMGMLFATAPFAGWLVVWAAVVFLIVGTLSGDDGNGW